MLKESRDVFMNKKLEAVIITAIIIMLVGWGKYIIPIKLEISDTQVVEVIGLDSAENGDVSLSLLFEPLRDEQDEGPKEKVLTVTGNSFIGTEKGIQNYEDKIFIGSHVKAIVVGENLLKNDLIRAIDYISKNNEFRLDSKIYVAKESTASELFNEGIDNDYILSNRIDTLSLTDKGEREVRNLEIVNIVRLLLSEEKSGVIPCIQIVENGDQQLADYVINSSKEEKKRVELAGYAVIKDAKLIGYLGNVESLGYDFIRNLISEEGFKLVYGEEIVGINLTNSDAKIEYEFSGDTLNKVIINIDTINSILETSSGKNLFANDISVVEDLENAYIKDIVESTIRYAQNVNVDFLEIGINLELKHPYKWRKIKDNWNRIFSTIPIEVKVNSNIDEQYGLLSSTGRS